jgi:hypothetical protein
MSTEKECRGIGWTIGATRVAAVIVADVRVDRPGD